MYTDTTFWPEMDNVQNISQYTIMKPLSKINTVYFFYLQCNGHTQTEEH